MRALFAAALCVAVLVALAAYGASAPAQLQSPGNQSLPAFVGIRTCLPFNILVKPNGNSSLVVEAEPAVAATVKARVAQGILTLSSAGDFRTTKTIKVTVNTAQALRFVQNYGIGDVIVDAGLNTTNFTVSATGTGGVYAFNVTSSLLEILASGLSNVYVNGKFNNTQVYATGSSKAYLTGQVYGPIEVHLDGFSTAFVQGSQGTRITGTADGLSKVLYTAGDCSVKTSLQALFGLNVFGYPCNQVSERLVPSVDPAWSCGMAASGTAECGPANSNASSGTGGQPQSSPAGPITNTVTGPGGSVTTSTFTSGPGASAVASGQVPGQSLTQQSKGGSTPTVVQTSRSGSQASNQDAFSWQSDLGPGTSSSQAVVSLTCEDPYPTTIPVQSKSG